MVEVRVWLSPFRLEEHAETFYCCFMVKMVNGRQDSTCTVWDLGYEASTEQLASLYEKSKRLQWNAATAIDWSQPIDTSAPLLGTDAFPMFRLPMFKRLSQAQREQLNAGFTAYTLSQILHGEQGALLVAAKLIQVTEHVGTKLYAASQSLDEARHVEVLERYIRRCEKIYDPDPTALHMLHKTLAARHWVCTMIGMQLVIEGMALTAFHDYLRSVTDPNLKKLLTLITRDESRHVAFGFLHIGEESATLSRDDREEVLAFTFDVILMVREAVRQKLRRIIPILQAAGVSYDDVCKDIVAAEAGGNGAAVERHRDRFDTAADFILPALRRVGLWDEGIAARLRKARLEDRGDSFLRTLEDN